jgi:hypothetical protein
MVCVMVAIAMTWCAQSGIGTEKLKVVLVGFGVFYTLNKWQKVHVADKYKLTPKEKT